MKQSQKWKIFENQLVFLSLGEENGVRSYGDVPAVLATMFVHFVVFSGSFNGDLCMFR